MRIFLTTLLLWSLFLTAGLAQQDADNRYLAIYGQLQQADSLVTSGQLAEALADYQTAQSQLQTFQQIYPTWEPDIVGYRLGDLATKIAALKAQVPAAVAAPVDTNAPTANPPAAAPEENSTVLLLQQQLQSLKDDNSKLQAKLQEALSAQPQTVDASALTKANDQIRDLTKENDLLRVSLEGKGTSNSENDVAQLQSQLDESQKTGAEQKATVEKLTEQNQSLQAALDDASRTNADFFTRLHDENLRLQAKLDAQQAGQNQAQPAATTPSADQLAANTAEVVRLKSAVDYANQENAALLDQLKHMAANLVSTDQRYQATVNDMTAQRDDLAKKLQAATTATPPPTVASLPAASPVEQVVQTNIPPPAATQPAAAVEASSTPAPATNPPAEPVVPAETPAVAVAQPATIAQAPSTPAPAAAQPQTTLEASSTSAPAALAPAVTEQTAPPPAAPTVTPSAPAVAAVPAAAETPAPVAQTPPVSEQPTNQPLPAGSADLVNSAQQHFSNHQFDLAEADYQKLLQMAPGNAMILANLAAIELEENKLDDAQKHITDALARSPDDSYNLAMRGKIEFAQTRFDDALQDLNHAAQLDPNNPETQNYLGLTLNHLGRNDAAEEALIKAIQLDPHYAPAQNNLAVIYMAEDPPLPQLARWHYQKALDAGQPRSPELEKLLAEKGAAVAPAQ
jgi:Tfp pilus assembly protein PilF